MNYLFVGLGGFFGSVARYAVSCAVAGRVTDGLRWPFATFAVNLAGAFLIGMLIGYFNNSTMPMHSCYLFCSVGFCGGFTTFSTFSLEVFGLLRDGQYGYAFGYAAASCILCVAAVGIGLKLMESKL